MSEDKLKIYDLTVIVGQQVALVSQIEKYLEDIKAANEKGKAHAIEDRVFKIEELLTSARNDGLYF
jgi:hypothetical protein